MKKDRKWFLSLVLLALIAACTTDAYDTTSTKKKKDDANKPLSETWHTDPKNYHCLNVVYYVPADVDTLNLWHRRLSGMTLNTQKFFKENLQRNRFDKTFGLVVNDSNQNYITISYVKSKKDAAKMQETDIKEMAAEVMDYFVANPDEKRSNHFLVYMPKYTGSFFNTIYLNPSNLEVADHAMAFCGCDAEKFDPKFLTSAKGRETYLKDLGQVMYELMHVFFQSDNVGVMNSSRYSLSGYINNSTTWANPTMKFIYNYTKYYEDLQKIDLTATDAMWLNQIQVFNEVGTHEYVPLEEVEIEDVKFAWIDDYEHIVDRDSLLVECTFRSSANLVGAVAYLDPWRTSKLDADNEDPNARNDGDAFAVSRFIEECEKVGNDLYKASFLFLWSDLHSDNIRNNNTDTYVKTEDPITKLEITNGICKGEVRFRFIAKGGMSYPNPVVSLKGDWGTAYRWGFTMRKYWNKTSYALGGLEFYVTDVVERYGESAE